jgi:serine protease Do
MKQIILPVLHRKMYAFPVLTAFFISLLSTSLLSPALNAQSVMDRSLIDRISMAVIQVHAPDGTGSGSLVEGSNLIYTNRHVVEGHYEFEIYGLTDPTNPVEPLFQAELLGFSEEYDFAVLRITGDMNGNPVINPHQYIARYSDSGVAPELQKAGLRTIPGRGDQIAIFGYPGIGDNELVFTTGIVSSVMYDTFTEERIPIWYRTNAEMSPGNSGGVATDMNGNIIGIPTYVRSESRTGGRLGSLLSMHVVQEIVDGNMLTNRWENRSSEAIVSASSSGMDELDFSVDPAYGSTSLSAGFTPDPHRVSVVSGGDIDASYLSSGCVGYAAEGPDYSLQWSGSSSMLRFYFMAENDGDDTSLIINNPDGSWSCNDDSESGSVDPLVSINNPQEGRYDIWVASYTQGEYIDGLLHITERELSPLASESGSTESGGSSSSSLDYSQDPLYGTVTLSAGFTPDPNEKEITSGGSVDVSAENLGSGCTGYASSSPDLRLQWSGDTDDLRIFFEPNQPGNDTVLIINAPNGNWVCNDDYSSDSLNPMVDLRGYPEGQYDIWIGSYSSGDYISGKLTITELSGTP